MPPLMISSPRKTGVAITALSNAKFISRSKGNTRLTRALKTKSGILVAIHASATTGFMQAFNVYDAKVYPTTPVSGNVLSPGGFILGFDVSPSGTVIAHPVTGNDDQRVQMHVSHDWGATWAIRNVPNTASSYRTVAWGLTDADVEVWLTCAPSRGNAALDGMMQSLTNGESWIDKTSLIPSGFAGVEHMAYSLANRRWVIIGGKVVAYSSNGGNSWTGTAIGTYTGTNSVSKLVCVNDKFIALQAGLAQICWSSDGLTWTAVNIPNGATTYNQVVYGEGIYIIFSETTGIYSYSFDLINWQTSTFPNSFKSSRAEFVGNNFLFLNSNQSDIYLTYEI